jgi:excisionase family DNA binding protein
MDNPDKYSTIEQTAQHYQVSVSTVRSWIRLKIIPFLKVGGVYRMKFSEIDAALRQRSENTPAAPPQQITAIASPADAVVIDPDQDV